MIAFLPLYLLKIFLCILYLSTYIVELQKGVLNVWQGTENFFLEHAQRPTGKYQKYKNWNDHEISPHPIIYLLDFTGARKI